MTHAATEQQNILKDRAPAERLPPSVTPRFPSIDCPRKSVPFTLKTAAENSAPQEKTDTMKIRWPRAGNSSVTITRS